MQGSDLVYILLLTVIPVALALLIALPFIADSGVRTFGQGAGARRGTKADSCKRALIPAARAEAARPRGPCCVMARVCR